MGGHHHHHGHDHAHDHHHHHHGDHRIGWAIAVNVALTTAQLIGSILAGSLALAADAIHNFSDAGALLLALIARKVARRAPDAKRTYGYKKVETLAAYTNFFTLILIAIWLAAEAIMRFFDPHPVQGNIVFWLAGLGFVINAATALMVRAQAHGNQNMRAAYLHHVTDAVSSLGVMVAGYLIHHFGWVWIDPLITIIISVYIIAHALHDFPDIINILIDGKASSAKTDDIITAVKNIDGVADIHHVHLRQLGEGINALEAHILLAEGSILDDVKMKIKEFLSTQKIDHSTLEFENVKCGTKDCC